MFKVFNHQGYENQDCSTITCYSDYICYNKDEIEKKLKKVLKEWDFHIL